MKTQYRNTKDLHADQGMIVDQGSLWNRNENGKMILVDDDEYITTDYEESFFE